jgi:uncharacterized protein
MLAMPKGDAMSFEPSEAVSQEFFDYLVTSHTLGHDGFHGRDHWLRVLHNAREIATATGASMRVLELFAVLHDSKRENENHDPDHGNRAAGYAAELRGTWFDLSDDEMDLLVEACRYHSDGLTDAHPTVQACWDADRLDLGRIGIRPDPQYLCTDYAKRPEVIEDAYARSIRDDPALSCSLSNADLHRILQRLQDDWDENFREYSVLRQWAEVISEDATSLTRAIRSHFYLFPDHDGFAFARNIPSSFVTEKCVWTLTWSDQDSFHDPIGFDESDYDAENIDIGGASWDDPCLPDDVFANAIARIDWWAVGEWLDDWTGGANEDFAEAPKVLRPYLLNALARYRRQALGRNGYLKYLITHPRFLWRLIRNRKLSARLEKEQFASFPGERH